MSKFSFTNIGLLFISAFVLRVGISLSPSFEIDMGTWQAWARMLVEGGLSHFFLVDVWNHYLPGYLYFLYVLGHLASAIEFIPLPLLIKLTTTFFDLGIGAAIYVLVKKKSPRWAFWATSLYLFNPALIFNTNIWGQVDGVLTLLLLLTIISIKEWDRPLLSGLFLGLSLVVKPQAIAVFPIWIYLVYHQKSFVPLIKSSLVSAATFFVFSFPFFPGNPFLGPIKLFLDMAGDYPFSSLFAFNLWHLPGSWIRDSTPFLGLSLFGWGTIAYLLSVFCILKFVKHKSAKAYFVSSLFFLAFFLFPTRVHERYLYPFFSFILIAAGLERSLVLLTTAAVLSLVHFLNLYYVYMYYNPNWLQLEPIKDLLAHSSWTLSLVSLGAFFLLLRHQVLEGALRALFKITNLHFLKTPSVNTSIPEIPWLVTHRKAVLVGILVFATATRLARLDIPNTHMFDEVYHAFTAQEIVKGNNAAWEWWNTPPKGFAYEWSHPPLGKELMAAGLKLLGDKPLGWRVPGAITGILSVFVVFLISWEIFRNQTLSLISAFIFSLDLLPVSMSRIGMNDSYFLFFLLLAFWFLLRERYLFMGLSFGLSLASKWTAIYFLGVIAFVWVQRRLWRSPKKTLLLTVSCLLLPIAIYLFSYLPFFTWGHPLPKFIELQEQMWWYHTGLKATHPYESGWWSWPLMLRPVWLYVNYSEKSIANIYAQGNPSLYWIGLVAAVSGLYIAVKRKNSQLKMVIFSYLLFFVPWAFSPRIMFLYHFLPATPFLSMIVAWFLLDIYNRGHQKLTLGLMILIFLSFLFFFPNVIALPIPTELDRIFFLLPSWK